MNKASLPEQLALLKSMTKTTGAIHEAQALQLKMWPRLIEKVTESEARVDVDKKTVTYICKSSGLRPTKNLKLTCVNICQWTRNLLWDETKVLIKINGKTVFDSDNQ